MIVQLTRTTCAKKLLWGGLSGPITTFENGPSIFICIRNTDKPASDYPPNLKLEFRVACIHVKFSIMIVRERKPIRHRLLLEQKTSG